MHIRPILSALRHHKAGAILIAVQIALTLAIVCNALFIIQQRLSQLSRPIGVDEAHLLRIQNQWVGEHNDYASLLAADLATLRSVPGVADVYATNSVPLSGGGWSTGIGLKPNQNGPTAMTAIYFADAHTLSTLGLKLVAGRNFRPDEISDMPALSQPTPPAVIITRALANKLYPRGDALGKSVYVAPDKPSTIIGVVKRLQGPWTGSFAAAFFDNSTLVPFRLITNGTNFVLRVRPGEMRNVMRAAPKALLASNRMRVIPDDDGVMPFSAIRAKAYASDRGMAILMGVISVILLCVTGAGIVGLTSFWVGQRRKQIGVRRALGATRRDILRYFQTENLLISGAGVVLGVVLAIGLNLWLMQKFAVDHMSFMYVLVGVVVLLLLGQAAVLAPALRASRVSPVEATRSA